MSGNFVITLLEYLNPSSAGEWGGCMFAKACWCSVLQFKTSNGKKEKLDKTFNEKKLCLTVMNNNMM